MSKALNNTYFYKPWSFLLFNYSCSFHIRKVEKHRGNINSVAPKKPRIGQQAGSLSISLCFYYNQLTEIIYIV